jgi:hypothetical protein
MEKQAFDLAPIGGLNDDQLKEMANLFAEKCQKAAQQTIRDAAVAGNALNVMRERVAHGEWVAWLGANFDYSRQTASAYMTLASNVKRFTFEPTSIREALRLISEQQSDTAESPIVPRSERKTGRVEVEKVGQAVVQADKSKPEKDDDPNPAPKTNTKHSAATAKAKEADRPAPQVVTPVIVEDVGYDRQSWDDILEPKTLADWPVSEIIGYLKNSADEPKKRAKELRKAADELDPPNPSTKFQRPDLDECLEFFQEHNSDQGETFFDFYESKGWLVGKVSMKDWKAAGRKWIRENQQNGKGITNGRQSAAQAREQSNADAFAQLRLAISNQQSGET